jgi:hypothetical protein
VQHSPPPHLTHPRTHSPVLLGRLHTCIAIARTTCPPRHSLTRPPLRNHPAGIVRSTWPASLTTWALTGVSRRSRSTLSRPCIIPRRLTPQRIPLSSLVQRRTASRLMSLRWHPNSDGTSLRNSLYPLRL